VWCSAVRSPICRNAIQGQCLDIRLPRWLARFVIISSWPSQPGLERVIFPHDGRGVRAYRAKVTDRSAAVGVRAYVAGDKDLSLLYAQDVSCAASFGKVGCSGWIRHGIRLRKW
jgi:hypothetical protein